MATLANRKLLLLKTISQCRLAVQSLPTPLSRVLYERGVDNKGFAVIRAKGDQASFGLNTVPNIMSYELDYFMIAELPPLTV